MKSFSRLILCLIFVAFSANALSGENGYKATKDKELYGNWGAAGAQQARGQWKAVGNLRQGQLIMVDQSGRQSAIPYRVHIKQGEVYWGAYLFNGRLYSVKYIYR